MRARLSGRDKRLSRSCKAINKDADSKEDAVHLVEDINTSSQLSTPLQILQG